MDTDSDQDYAILEAGITGSTYPSKVFGHLKISLARTDTICYFNPQGQYICELNPSPTSLDLRSNGHCGFSMHPGWHSKPENSLLLTINQCINRRRTFRDTKPGMATLKGELKATTNNGLEDIYSIRVRYQNYLWQTQITVEVFVDPQRRFSLQTFWLAFRMFI